MNRRCPISVSLGLDIEHEDWGQGLELQMRAYILIHKQGAESMLRMRGFF